MKVYECDSCGLCCKSLIIEADHFDVLREPRIAERGRLLDGHGKIPFVDAAWGLYPQFHRDRCPFLMADNRCEIYPSRPNVCVGFMAGSEKCQELRENAGLTRLQPVERDDVVAKIINLEWEDHG